VLAAFDAEHREHIAAIRVALAAAETGRPADWNDVFRRAHSLKGAARAVDLPAVEEVAHRLEALFDRVVQGRHGLDRATAGVVDLALDRIEGLVAGLAETPEPAAPADAIAALDACLSGAPIPGAAEPAAATEQAPEPAAPAAPQTTAQTTIQTSTPQDGAVAYLRIASDQVEALSKAVHDLNAALQGQETVAAAVAGLESGARTLRRSVDTVQGRTGEMVALARRLREAGDPAGAALDGFVDRVRRLDGDLRGVIRGISGLARVQSRSTGVVDGALRRLRDDSDRLLLVPAETVFGGYGRMVREIAREAGLAVEVRLHGLDLQVDRGLLQALKDPVLHALRNTISHGAEPEPARRAAGKPEALGVTLSVASKGSQLVVTIRDDGRGPDLARILETGRRQGLVPPGAEPTPDEILDLVFAPGFSTAPAVDRIAGRGMGLSVVAEAARALRGRAPRRRGRDRGAALRRAPAGAAGRGGAEPRGAAADLRPAERRRRAAPAAFRPRPRVRGGRAGGEDQPGGAGRCRAARSPRVSPRFRCRSPSSP
jgi:two-component system chemotaxis sensor kinase CheA